MQKLAIWDNLKGKSLRLTKDVEKMFQDKAAQVQVVLQFFSTKVTKSKQVDGQIVVDAVLTH